MCGCVCLKARWYDEGLKKGAEIKEEAMKEAVREYREELKRVDLAVHNIRPAHPVSGQGETANAVKKVPAV